MFAEEVVSQIQFNQAVQFLQPCQGGGRRGKGGGEGRGNKGRERREKEGKGEEKREGGTGKDGGEEGTGGRAVSRRVHVGDLRDREQESGTPCLHMLSSPRISDN